MGGKRIGGKRKAPETKKRAVKAGGKKSKLSSSTGRARGGRGRARGKRDPESESSAPEEVSESEPEVGDSDIEDFDELAVEDDDQFIIWVDPSGKVTGKLLKDAGYDVETFNSTKGCLDFLKEATKAKREKLAAVITSMMEIPDRKKKGLKNGLEMLDEIQKMYKKLDKSPVYVVSSRNADAKECKKKHGVSMVVKGGWDVVQENLIVALKRESNTTDKIVRWNTIDDESEETIIWVDSNKKVTGDILKDEGYNVEVFHNTSKCLSYILNLKESDRTKISCVITSMMEVSGKKEMELKNGLEMIDEIRDIYKKMPHEPVFSVISKTADAQECIKEHGISLIVFGHWDVIQENVVDYLKDTSMGNKSEAWSGYSRRREEPGPTSFKRVSGKKWKQLDNNYDKPFFYMEIGRNLHSKTICLWDKSRSCLVKLTRSECLVSMDQKPLEPHFGGSWKLSGDFIKGLPDDLTKRQIQALTYTHDTAKADSVKKRGELRKKINSLCPKLKIDDKKLDLMVDYVKNIACLNINVNLSKVPKSDGKKILDLFTEDKEGHYRNLFEVLHGGGCTSLAPRASWEDRMYNKAYGDFRKNPPGERPKYGNLNIFERSVGHASCAGYGKSYFVLKDQMRCRTTLTPADSSGTSNVGMLDNCNHILLDALGRAGSAKTFCEVWAEAAMASHSKKDHKISDISSAYYCYIELQFHGNVSFDKDIESLIIHPDESLSDKQIDKFIKRFPTIKVVRLTHADLKAGGKAFIS